MKLRPKVGFCVIRHPFEEGAEAAPRIEQEATAGLKSAGLDVLSGGVIEDLDSGARAGELFKSEDVDVVCLAAATWSSDAVALETLERANVPAITWGLPGINTGSLCGTHQLDCVLSEIGREYKFVYGGTDEASAYDRIRSYAMAAATRRRLRFTRLGLVGHRIEGMTEVAFDEFSLKNVFGPTVVHISVDQFLARRDAVAKADAEDVWRKAKAVAGCVDVPDSDGLTSARSYVVLKRFCEENGLSGFTTECYPNLMGQVCLAYSLLAEEGIVASCEGDMNSALLTLILYWLSGEPVHNTDLLAIFEEENTVLGSHCGSGAASIAESKEKIQLGHVRLAHQGVCVLFPAKPGPVTWVNLVGREGTYRITFFTGEAIPTGMIFAGNPLLTKVNVPVRELLDRIAEVGAGHHWMACYGHVQRELRELAQLEDIQCEEIA